MRTFLVTFITAIALMSCKPEEKKLSAQDIIDQTIKASGADKIENSDISFDFRSRTYKALRNNGMFSLKRITKQGDSVMTDILSNDGFKRLINDKPKVIADSMATKYSESVNSVHYFSVLPYGLNDKAVQKKILENSIVKGIDYYKVEISFQQDGGGVDFEDVFIYWIHKQTFKIDYLAYTFHVNGGGMRFRSVRNEKSVNGIRFVDYDNYKPKDTIVQLANLDRIYQAGELIKASEINLENIKVSFPSD